MRGSIARGRRIVEWLIVVAALVIGIPAAAWLAQERLIFFPQPLTATTHLPAHATVLEIVASDGTRLSGYEIAARAQPAPMLIYFGGNAEEISWTLADARWPRRWSIAGLNYRGYGRSEGKPSEQALVADRIQFRKLDQIELDACNDLETRMLARRLKLSLFRIERKDSVGLLQWQQQKEVPLAVLKRRLASQ